MFENMKLGTKLVASFLTVSFIGLIISVIGIVGMSSIDGYVDKLYKKDLLGVSYIKNAQNNRLDAGRRWRDVLIAQSLDDKKRYVKQFNESVDAYEENIQKGSELFYSDDATKVVVELKSVNTEWKNLTTQMVALILEQNLTSQTPEFLAIRKIQESKGKDIDTAIQQLSTSKQSNALKTMLDSKESYENKLILMIVLVSIGFIVSVWIGFSKRLVNGKIIEKYEIKETQRK